MRVLFCHDGPLQKDELDNYYGSAHNDETFKRYYTIADELGVIIRVRDIPKEKATLRFSKITVNPLKITEIPNIANLKGQLFKKNKAKAIIKKEVERSDYVIARLPSTIGFMSINYAKELKKPYLVELVTCPWDAYWNHSLKGKVVAPIIYKKTQRYIRDAPYVVYVTNNFLQKRYPTNGKNISCSNVALKNIDEKILQNRLDKIRKMKNNKKVILGTTAAVNVRFKGQQYIIQALGKLRKQGITNIEYQLVGNGDQSYLKAIAQKNNVSNQVKFLGGIPHNEVFEWLKTIDVYVQPSRQEGLPRALIEAMSLGLPAFGANTAGIPELLDENYIFSNTKKNIDEICSILEGYNTSAMIYQSKSNFYEAKKYEYNVLEKRRSQFFKLFKYSLSSRSKSY